MEAGVWEDPEFLKPFEKKGESVSVQVDDQKTLKLTAILTKTPDSAEPENISSPDLRDAPVSGESLELQGVVSWNDAIRRARQLDHARLILQVAAQIRFAESRAGLVLGEIPPQIDIIRR